MRGNVRTVSFGSFLVLILSILILVAIPLASAQSSWTETSSSDFNDGTFENTEVVSDDVRLLNVPYGDWTQATSNASWSGRSSHTSVVFRDAMWVIGGYDGSHENDVWYSSDGSNWTRATSEASWAGRWGHTSMPYDGKMWVLGGKKSAFGGGIESDVWYSSDGSNWTQATSSASWAPRYVHSAIPYDGKMWVLGGISGGALDDVWSSSDGSNWSEATSDASWVERWDHASIVYDGKIWVIGGRESNNPKKIDLDDVWSSSDGSSWTQVTSDASWSTRSRHTSVVYNGKMWVLGGENAGTYHNDIWYSSDGSNWTQATSSADWSERARHTSLVYDNKVWVIGGYDGAKQNDVWWWAPYRDLGTYVSSNHDTGADDTEISQVSWNATGSNVSVQVAAGNNPDPTNWETVSNGDTSIGANGRYVRYRVAFNGSGLSDNPELNSVTIDYSTPNSSPTADFSYTTDGLTVDFTDSSTDSDGSISSWSWDFGDGNASTQQSPSHSYSSSGSYTVELEVTDDDGAKDTKLKTISVSESNQSPTADFSYTTDGLTVDFTDSSTDPDGSNDLASWSWDFDGDGMEDSTAQSPSYTYSSENSYEVTLTVGDDKDATDKKTKTVTVSGKEENANVVKVSGYVKSGGEPVEGATVTIGEKTAKTDSEGYYIFDNLDGNKTYEATVSASGYESYSKNFSLGSQDKTLGNINLEKQAEGGVNTMLIAGIVIVIAIVIGVVIYFKR